MVDVDQSDLGQLKTLQIFWREAAFKAQETV